MSKTDAREIPNYCEYQDSCGARDQIREIYGNPDSLCQVYGSERRDPDSPECKTIMLCRSVKLLGKLPVI